MIAPTLMDTPSRTRPNTFAYWLSLAGVCAAIAIVWLVTRAERFADFDTYVLYVDQLVHFPPDNWWYFELFSNAILLALHAVINSVEGVVVLAHYLLGVLFVALLVRAFPPATSSWLSVVFLFALLGPLLAFVTLRATPAYFLIAAATLRAERLDRLTWMYVAAAFLFHASALLALPAMVLLYFRHKLPTILNGRSLVVMSLVGLIAYGIMLTLFPGFLNVGASFLKSTPYLVKYIAYTDDILPADHVTSINHYFFFAFVIVLTTVFLLRRYERHDGYVIYIVSSLIIYIIMFTAFSPVAAFRQAPFFVMPMISLFPWQRVGVRGPAALVFVLLSVGVFVFQMDQAYI